MPPVTKETLLRYCQMVYDALSSSSTVVDGVTLWEGGYTKLFSGLGISNAHYSQISSALQEAGSIEILRRGARGSTTQIALHRRPEAADVEGQVGSDPVLTRPTPSDKLAQRVSNLERRLEGVDVMAYIAKTEKRLQALEAEAKSHKT